MRLGAPRGVVGAKQRSAPSERRADQRAWACGDSRQPPLSGVGSTGSLLLSAGAWRQLELGASLFRALARATRTASKDKAQIGPAPLAAAAHETLFSLDDCRTEPCVLGPDFGKLGSHSAGSQRRSRPGRGRRAPLDAPGAGHSLPSAPSSLNRTPQPTSQESWDETSSAFRRGSRRAGDRNPEGAVVLRVWARTRGQIPSSSACSRLPCVHSQLDTPLLLLHVGCREIHADARDDEDLGPDPGRTQDVRDHRRSFFA